MCQLNANCAYVLQNSDRYLIYHTAYLRLIDKFNNLVHIGIPSQYERSIMFIQRAITDTIRKSLNAFPVVLVTGPRQVGKTTVLKENLKDTYKYVSLDDLEYRNLAKTDPKLFLSTFSAPLIIDEIQYAPELFSCIKQIVDERRNNGLYVLTGSQKFHLMKNISESLAGRVAILDILGLSFSEIKNRKSSFFIPQNIDYKVKSDDTLMGIYERIWKGSFPVFYAGDNIDRDIFYKSYISTYIKRDIMDLTKISDESAFMLFLRALAARTGQLLNLSDIARDVSINNTTAKAWLSLVETTGLVYLLRPYHSNTTKRIIKTPKLYFLDTGLCCFLTKWTSPETLEAGNMNGAILETYIFQEILKSYWNTGKDEAFYFYRDTDQKEIDLLIDSDGTLYPIEIKKTATPSNTASKNFSVLEKTGMKIGRGAVICFINNPIPLSRNVTAIPIGTI